ncbi:hypothetical protein ACWGPW_27660 [Paenibacillus chitinolyticus]
MNNLKKIATFSVAFASIISFAAIGNAQTPATSDSQKQITAPKISELVAPQDETGFS